MCHVLRARADRLRRLFESPGGMWHRNSAKRRPRKDNTPILYYFKAWDSTLHRNMLKNVLRNPGVDKALRETVNIELEYGFFDEQSDRFKVRKPQVCVFAAPDGTRLTPNLYVNPVPTPAAFLKWLNEAKSKAPQLAKPQPAAKDQSKTKGPATADVAPTESGKQKPDETPGKPATQMQPEGPGLVTAGPYVMPASRIQAAGGRTARHDPIHYAGDSDCPPIDPILSPCPALDTCDIIDGCPI